MNPLTIYNELGGFCFIFHSMIKKIIILGILSICYGQTVDVYNRQFQSGPDFEIDVQHYDISLQIYDHIKTFTGETAVTFKIIKNDLKSIKLDVETVTITHVLEGSRKLNFTQTNGAYALNQMVHLNPVKH